MITNFNSFKENKEEKYIIAIYKNHNDKYMVIVEDILDKTYKILGSYDEYVQVIDLAKNKNGKFLIMNINEYLEQFVNDDIQKKNMIMDEYYNMQENYQGDHTAPSTDDSPLYNVSLNESYPDDFYKNPRQYMSHQSNDENEAISIIMGAHNRPNYKVKVYRAVPDFNREIDKKIKNLVDIFNYRNKFGFFPMRNDTVNYYNNKAIDIYFDGNVDNNPNYHYGKHMDYIVKLIDKDIEELVSKRKPKLTINNGDWVSIVKNYAKEHGKDNLKNNYKIISKTVLAKELFTDGNSLLEWGYNKKD